MYYYLAVVAKDRYLDTIQGGGGRMSIFEYSPRKWPKTPTQIIFE